MLIGLSGCKGVGKDTAAQWLIEEQGYTRLAFADKLKEAVANLLDISVEEVDNFKAVSSEGWITRKPSDPLPQPTTFVVVKQGGIFESEMSWREFLQRFGTEMGRNTFGQDFWIEQWIQSLSQLKTTGYDIASGGLPSVVVTDVRFENEAKAIKLYDGYIIEITRPGHKPDGHASEDPIPSILVDATVRNESNLEDFKSRFLATVEGLSMGIVA